METTDPAQQEGEGMQAVEEGLQGEKTLRLEEAGMSSVWECERGEEDHRLQRDNNQSKDAHEENQRVGVSRGGDT